MDALKMVSEIAGVDPGKLTPETRFGDLNGWDSLKMVRLVIGLEQAIDRELTEDELENLASIKDVAAVLSH